MDRDRIPLSIWNRSAGLAGMQVHRNFVCTNKIGRRNGGASADVLALESHPSLTILEARGRERQTKDWRWHWTGTGREGNQVGRLGPAMIAGLGSVGKERTVSRPLEPALKGATFS